MCNCLLSKERIGTWIFSSKLMSLISAIALIVGSACCVMAVIFNDNDFVFWFAFITAFFAFVGSQIFFMIGTWCENNVKKIMVGKRST